MGPQGTSSLVQGFIAVCKNWTEEECLDRMLFASLPDWFDKKVSRVRRGDIGFLLNLDTDMLFGIFRAESDGQMNIDPTAFGGRYPAQVRVLWEKKYPPISNAKSILIGLNIGHWNYILTFVETEAVRKLFENPQDEALVIVRTGLTGEQREQPMFKAEDGHFVRSKSEALIDNWLYNHGLAHAYERRPPIPEDLKCDFYVPAAKSYIEYWGLEGDEEYLKRKQTKLVLYEKHGLRLVELKETDIVRLDDILGRYFGPYLRD